MSDQMTDHAELARLAEAERDAATFLEASLMREALQKRLTAPVVLALLAENAALRGDVERVEADRTRTVDDRTRWTRRALEAERKLAEAAEIMKDVQRCTQGPTLDRRITAFLASMEPKT